jgi:hypothetical protein
MKIKAFYNNNNPFVPNQLLVCSNTVAVPDNTDMDWLKKMAIEATPDGYHFDRLEKAGDTR